MSAAPQGSFIRPVGVYGYCYEVVRVIPRDDEGDEQWQCKRWGMDSNRQPMKDGHSDIHYLNGLKQIAIDVWKDEWNADTPRWSCCPLYYRKINTSCHTPFQIGLFE